MISRWIAAGSVSLVFLVLTGLWIRDALVRWRIEGPTQDERRFAAANAELADASGAKRIVFIGDSRIARWQPPPAIAGHELIFRGVGGESAVRMRRRFIDDAIALRPSIIFVQTGINDLVAASYLGRSGREDVVREVEAAFAYFAKVAGDAGICLVIGTIVQPAAPQGPRSWIWRDNVRDAVSRVNGSLAGKAEQIIVVDLNRALDVAADVLAPSFAVDEVHLNAAAYSKINVLLPAYFDRCGVKPSGK